MLQIVPTCAVGVTILLCISYTESAFNWDHLGGPPPEIEEPIAYETVPTAQPTPRWAKRIRDFLKTNRPRHPVEMLFPSNETALAEEHKQIKANMTKIHLGRGDALRNSRNSREPQWIRSLII